MFSNSAHNIKMAKIAILLTTLVLMSCSKSGSSSTGVGGSNGLVPNFRLSLTDAPNGAFSSIKVNVESINVVLTDGKKTAIVPLTQGSGVVDLLGLQNGVTMGMGDLQIPKGVKITEVHVKLAKGNHEGVRLDGSKCKLPVSCGATPDVYKLTLDNPIDFDDDHHSNLVIDFDAKSSITDDDHESEYCGFRPSINVKSAAKWKPEQKGDDDFDSKGKGLNNHEAVRDQTKKFGKEHHDGDDHDDELGRSSNNQCVTIQSPAPVVVVPAPTPTVVTPAPVVAPTAPAVVPTAVPNFFGAA